MATVRSRRRSGEREIFFRSPHFRFVFAAGRCFLSFSVGLSSFSFPFCRSFVVFFPFLAVKRLFVSFRRVAGDENEELLARSLSLGSFHDLFIGAAARNYAAIGLDETPPRSHTTGRRVVVAKW